MVETSAKTSKTARGVASKRNKSHRVFSRWYRFAILCAIACLLVPASVVAAEASLAINWSPEAARMIRDWRRSQGLPQAPEDAAPPRMPGLEEAAIRKALTFGGLSTPAGGNANIAATHMRNYWKVVVHRPEGDFTVDVSDSVLARASSRAVNAPARSE